MRLAIALSASLVALSFGCSSTPPKQADDPSNAAGSGSSDEQPPPAKEASSDEPKQEALSSGAKGDKKQDDTIPDDYSLTPGDCDALGKQYAAVAKSDQMAGVSPKLSEKQKAQAEDNIDKVVGKLASTWIQGCQETLAGNVVDRKSLKCAMDSKSVAEFKKCIGDESKPGEKVTPRPGGKKK